jgi:CBS domain-containing protein
MAGEMMEPAQFLRTHPPFDHLGPEALRIIEASLEVAYHTQGSAIFKRGGPPGQSLFVIRKGAVRLERDGQLVQLLEEGDSFGVPSLIGRTSPHQDAVAIEDTLLYQIPEPTFARLIADPAFAEFFLADLSARLRRTAGAESTHLGADLATPVDTFGRRAPIFVSPDVPVREAALRMREARVSSVLVEGSPPGILTDRDLRGRVIAEGLGPETLVRDVMTPSVKSLPARDTLFEALVFMLEHDVHHAPLEEGGRIVGIVTDTDILRLHNKSPLYLLRELRTPRTPESLSQYAVELAAMVEVLTWSGLDAVRIGPIVSRLNDTLVVRLLKAAEADLGRPPTPYAWIVFGSEGRTEQTLLTDQDNAIVYEEDTAEAKAYYAALAERVVNGLIAAHFPPCRGGFMATNWHRPLAEWVRLFRGLVRTPEPRALVEAANFFDFRPVHGGLSLGPLQDILRQAGREKIFLAHLAKAALGFRPPLGLFRQIRIEEGGVDLKKGGIIPIVSLARLFSLEAGAEERPTLARLRAAAQSGTLSKEGAETLTEAFRFLLRLRLQDQLRAMRLGQPPGQKARIEDVSPLERRHLKETFLAIREIQEATAIRYAVDRLP